MEIKQVQVLSTLLAVERDTALWGVNLASMEIKIGIPFASSVRLLEICYRYTCTNYTRIFVPKYSF